MQEANDVKSTDIVDLALFGGGELSVLRQKYLHIYI